MRRFQVAPSHRSTSAGVSATASGVAAAESSSREPARLHGRDPERLRPADVLAQAVADHHGLARLDSRLRERGLEHQRVRLPLADLGRERDRIEALEQPDLGEELAHQRRRVEERSRPGRPSARAPAARRSARRRPARGDGSGARPGARPPRSDSPLLHRFAAPSDAKQRRDLGRVVELVLPLADEQRQQLLGVGVGEVRLRRRARLRRRRGPERAPRRTAPDRTPRRRACCPSRRRLPGSPGG